MTPSSPLLESSLCSMSARTLFYLQSSWRSFFPLSTLPLLLFGDVTRVMDPEYSTIRYMHSEHVSSSNGMVDHVVRKAVMIGKLMRTPSILALAGIRQECSIDDK